MKRFAATLFLAAMIIGAAWLLVPAEDGAGAAQIASGEAPASDDPTEHKARRIAVEVVSERPHDPSAFTQGLLLRGGKLFESTGGFGTSSVRRVEPLTGEVEERVDLPRELFGEGLAAVGDRLIQLTWQAGTALVWDAESFAPLERLSYDGEGWGLCFDGGRLIMSDGTDLLTFRNPTTFAIEGRVRVSLDGRALGRLNELECVDGAVWANVWQTDLIVGIDPFSGRVTTLVDLSGLLSPEARSRADVLNGVAHDAQAGTWLVTGKLWPTLFEVRFVAR